MIFSTTVEINRYLVNSFLKDLFRRVEFEDKEEDKFLNALNRQNNLLIGNDISVRFLGEAIKDMRDHQIWQIY